VVRVNDRDLATLRDREIVTATGGPGTTVLLNCRTVHGSEINRSPKMRPLLLPVFSSADSFPYTTNAMQSPHQGDIVRGKRARFASFDTRPVEVPPDFRAGYRPPWLMQKAEEERKAAAE
jgi:ectoine hydroxylase-related dioxygenase (phytanoyl-CoA dioxygenase family)